MYKKSAELVHLHERTASHATKGTGSGLVEHRKLDDTDFHSEASNQLRWARIKELKKLRSGPNRGYWRIVAVLKICDAATRDGLISTMRQLLEKIREIDLEISELKAVTKQPFKAPKRTFSSKEERKAYYVEQNARMKKQKRLTK